MTFRLPATHFVAIILLCVAVFGAKAQDIASAPAPLRNEPVASAGPTLDPAPGLAPGAAPYRIARGDELNLKFFYTPELNTIATVRSDGRIGIPLIGDLVVEGLSPGELAATITARLATQVRRPEVAINVQGASSQRIFIGGEVIRAGVQPLVGPLSVAQAVMVAEGLKETARSSDVVLIRRGAQNERVVMHLNLAAALDGSDTSQDIALQPYDVVVVPRSGIANVNLWVDQYVRRNLPISLGISYSINSSGGALQMNPHAEWADTAVMPLMHHTLRVAPITPYRNTLREILTLCFRDRRRIGLAFLFPFLATIVLCFMPTPRYTSDASLLLRLGREYTYTPETGDSRAAQPMAYDREQTLHAEVEILTSRDVKESAIDKIGVATLYPAIAAGQPDPEKQRSAALLEMQHRFDAALMKDSNVVRLSFTHTDAQLSARALNTLIDVYLDRRRAIFNSTSSHGAEADVAALRTRMSAAEGKLDDWKRTHRIQSFGEQQSLLLAQRQAVAMKLAESDYLLAQTTGRSRSLNASLAATPADVTLSNETQRSEALEGARKTLLDLRLKERDLSSKFTDDNLSVQDVRADIGRTETFLRELEAHPNRSIKTGRSVVRDGVESDLVRSMAEQRQTAASRATLIAQRDAVESQLTQLSSAQRELDTLDRERRLVEAAYEQASRGLEDEIVVEHLDQRHKSNVSIVQAARVPLVSQNIRGIIFAVGLLFSLACALMVAFISALWRDTYLSPEDVQRGLGLPLLAAVPRRMLA